MHLCDLLFKINDGQKPPECALWLNDKRISEADIVKHYRVDYKTERNMFKVSIPHFESELKGEYECEASTVDEEHTPVSTSVKVIVTFNGR